MLRRRLEVSCVCLSWWLLCIVFLSSSVLGAIVQTKENQPSPASRVPFIFDLLTVMSNEKEWIHVEEIQKNCPKLWSLNGSVFKNERLTGVLGSLDDMRNYCLSNQTQSPSLACQGAIGISSYMCRAMTTMSNLEQPLYPLDQKMSEKLSHQEGLCEILSDINFQETLCLSVNAATHSSRYDCKNLVSLDSFQSQCTDLCTGEGNKRACEIILQSLRTITYWEKQKERAVQKEESASTVSESILPSFSQDKDVPPAVFNKPDTTTPLNPSKTVSFDNTTKVNGSSSAIVGSSSSVFYPNTNSFNNDTLVSSISPIPVISAKHSDTRLPVELQKKGPHNPKFFEKQNELEPEEEIYPLEGPEKPSSSPDEDPVFEEDNPNDMEDSIHAPVKPASPIYETQIPDVDDGPVDTHFLFYFLAFVILSVTTYIIYQRRNRIIALVVEGRSGSSSTRRRSKSLRGERPSSGSYRKLVNNLEEAITSHSVKNSNVIY